MTGLKVCLLFSIILKVICIWPPPHEIHLEDEETFIINEGLDSDDLFSDGDEMIPVKESSDERKYFRIHQMALLHNKRELSKKKTLPTRKIRKIKEQNFDLEDPLPWTAGFVDKEGNFIQLDNENVYYSNEMSKSLLKRENVEKAEKPENYDYGNFKAEYEADVEKSKTAADVFNYTEVTEEENLKDAIKAVVEFKDPKNCSAEEKKGIGIDAMKCIVADLKTARSQNSILNLLEKVLRISLIWFCVYVVIAVPCWCQRGWCCCCCCCKLCRPHQTIEEAKRFFTQNPVGTFHTKEGKKVNYEPTNYEIYTQRQLEKMLFNL